MNAASTPRNPKSFARTTLTVDGVARTAYRGVTTGVNIEGVEFVLMVSDVENLNAVIEALDLEHFDPDQFQHVAVIDMTKLPPGVQEQLERGLDFCRAVGLPTHPKDAMDTIESTAIATPAIPFDLAAGEHYAGLSRDHDTGAWHHLVLLPATTDKDLTWKEAIDWAKSVGGELPTRFESALLYANLRDKVDTSRWHWTATEVEGETKYAWIQSFSGGTQYYGHEGDDHRARAVRRVPV